MARLLAVVLAALAGVVGVQGFLARPMVPHTGAVQQQGAEVRPLAAPLQMAKHPQFKIIKKKMHKRPKKSRPSDRNRRLADHAVDKRDMSGPGWVFPGDEGWVVYDEAVHGPLDEDIKPLVEGLDPIWVRIVDPATGAPKLADA